MKGPTAPVDIALDTFRRAQFGMLDIMRRTQADALGAFGLSPAECDYRVIASGPYWRLRDYGGEKTSPQLLIIAAPIKRPYIWDLTPSVSAIRYCLSERWRVCLLEWLPATPDGSYGIDEYADAISQCVARISDDTAEGKPFLVGHSLGGTLAAIYSAWAPASIRALVLLSAPIRVAPYTTRFRDALVSVAPSTFSDADPCPGSLLSQVSALASPETFLWSRFIDAVRSMNDSHALDIHARVERWALDEVPLPGRLVHEIIDWLYRENRFCRGSLTVGRAPVGPSSVFVPVFVFVNTADEVAPMASVAPFAEALRARDFQIAGYPGEAGVCLQHLGILVGRVARVQIWPQLVSWINAHSKAPAA